MVEFRCTLTAEAITRLYGAISCLGKFHEVLGLDISTGHLALVTLNSTRTSCACIQLRADTFFQSYHFRPDEDETGNAPTASSNSGDGSNHFRCQLYNRSLLSVFKTKTGVTGVAGGGSSGGPTGSSGALGSRTKGGSAPSIGGGGPGGGSGGARESDSATERCEIVLQDSPERIECRLIISIVARSGVRKTYKLTYEPTDVPRAVFDRAAATSRWSMSGHTLKSFTEYFGARTELLDIYCDAGKASFTSYTEKVMKGSEVLRQPLQTTIDIDTLDFSDFEVEEQMHIGVSVKDFRAIVVHADSLRAVISAFYSRPGRPMQLYYEELGLICEFTLATTGQYRGTAVTPAPQAGRAVAAATSAAAAPSRPMQPVTLSQRPATARSSSRPVAAPTTNTAVNRPSTEMPPPPSRAPSVRPQQSNPVAPDRPVRPPPVAPSASVDEESLFVPDYEDDRQWDENAFDAEEDQLGWNNSYEPSQLKTLTQGTTHREQPGPALESEESEIPPTQSMTNMRGLFD